mmetsp:Transcript_24216/g.72287  ORF Transcript_24216/g.72287 Transcript_24216/m.72287 type:complete len:625 (+) Transcript_24216:266-2140(+)
MGRVHKATTSKGKNRAHGKVKKGVKGEASQFMSRTVAVRKLQLSLPDFRRLCILKGVYPREPNKKRVVGKGSTANKTYYHTKDIKFLMHEPLIQKFRDFKIFLRKLKRAVAKKDRTAEERMLEARPTLEVDHLIKERYPTMIDAVRDLDDALCMVFLFAQMPQAHKVQNHTVRRCRRLTQEFEQYLVRANALEKTFLSIKGIYYRATILGQPVTWIAPYKFSIRIPTDVDFRVMDTFLLFYTKLLGFVNFSLYTQLGLHYPPRVDETRDKNDIGLSALILEPAKGPGGASAADAATAGAAPDDALVKPSSDSKVKERMASLKEALPEIEGQVSSDDSEDDAAAAPAAAGDALDTFPEQMEGGEEAIEDIETAMRLAAERGMAAALFKGLYFFLGRETPRYSLEFVIPSFGGAVSWEGVGGDDLGAGPYDASDKRITHHIIDRPTIASPRVDRHYVQPQWIYDCINCKKLLPTAPYTIGAVLPPHQSPFGDEGQDASFVPPDPTTLVHEDVDDDAADEEGVESSDEEAVYRKELEDESKGKPSAAKPKVVSKKKAKKSDAEKLDEEHKELAKSMMSKKQARLYNQIMHGRKQKEEEKATLMRKRKAKAKAAQATPRSAKRGKTEA